MTSPSGEDSRSPADFDVADRDSVVQRYRAVRDEVPSEGWMATYALMNCLNLHSDRMWRHITSADRARTMFETLLLCLIKDKDLLEDFVSSSGNADVQVDNEGRVSRIEIDGRSYGLRGRMRNRFQKRGRCGMIS